MVVEQLKPWELIRPREQGIGYADIGDFDLRITLRAGELARVAAELDPILQRSLRSQHKTFVDMFGSGDDSGLNLEFVVERLTETEGQGCAIRVLTKTLERIDTDHSLNGDKEGIIIDVTMARDQLRKEHRASKRSEKSKRSKVVDFSFHKL